MSSVKRFPVLDFSKFKSQFDVFSQEVFKASNEWGFFILTKSGIQNVDRMFELSRQFFDLPFEQKASKIMNEQTVGYDGNNMTTFAASEGMSFGLPAGRILTTDNLPIWWDTPKREEIEAFKAQCYDLSRDLMSCFAVQLGLEKDFFLQAHQHIEPGNNMKMIKYPRMEKQTEGIPRLSEHTDWGSITFVFSTQGGLEVRNPKNDWYPVPVIPGGIVVNIGDALSLWTDKALKSTMHRITWENLPIDQDRYSIAYFVSPNYDAPLYLPGSSKEDLQPTLTYRDFYKIRLRLTYGSLQDSKSGKKVFEDVDPEMLKVIRKLGVANAGMLESNHLIKV